MPEHPPLGKSHTHAFDMGDTAFPILAIAADPRAPGYAVPADLAPHPDTANWPNHKFGQVMPTATDQRVLWLYYILPGALSTGEFYDSLTDTILTETRQRQARTAADPTLTAYTADFHRDPQDGATDIFIIRAYPSGITGKTVVTYEPDNFIYPAIMVSVASAAITDIEGHGHVKITPVIQAERPMFIAKRVTRTFVTTIPTDAAILTGLYPIYPIRHRYDGFFYNFVTGPVLCDAGSLTYTTGSNDPTWGAGVVETYTWGDSTPTATAYVASRTAGEWKMFEPRSVRKIAKAVWMIEQKEQPVL